MLYGFNCGCVVFYLNDQQPISLWLKIMIIMTHAKKMFKHGSWFFFLLYLIQAKLVSFSFLTRPCLLPLEPSQPPTPSSATTTGGRRLRSARRPPRLCPSAGYRSERILFFFKAPSWGSPPASITTLCNFSRFLMWEFFFFSFSPRVLKVGPSQKEARGWEPRQ